MIPSKTSKTSVILWVRNLMFGAALVGLFASIYLLIVYTTGGSIACGIVHGCDTVRASKWAYFYGIPRPALGVIFYATMLGLLIMRSVYSHRGLKATRLYWMTWALALFGLIESVDLVYIQAYIIEAYCLWCLASAAATFVLCASSFFDGDRPLASHEARRELKLQFVSLFAAVVIGAIALYFLLYTSVDGELPKISKVNVSSISGQVTPTILPADIPVEGPATSTVTVVEFIDFQCPGCRTYAETINKMRADFKGRIRFAQRQFPLVQIHPHAKDAAIAAVCADKQGKYFPMADALIVNDDTFKREDLIHYAAALKLDVTKFTTCIDDPATATQVEQLRQTASNLGLHVTPTIFINDVMLDGLPDLATLEQLISKTLSK